jgi:hypothetical protein
MRSTSFDLHYFTAQYFTGFDHQRVRDQATKARTELITPFQGFFALLLICEELCPSLK